MVLSMGPGLTVGIDLGGTKMTMVVTDRTDRLLHEETLPTDRARVADQVVQLVERATAAFSPGQDGIEGVGIAAPGQVDAHDGVVRLAVNLDSAEIPLARLVGEATGLPCLVEHDARAAAAWLVQRDGTRDLAYLSVGTGISAGLVIDGRLLRGAVGLAGEIGHTVADPNGPMCTCGLRGCLEAVAAGPAIARLAQVRREIESTDGVPTAGSAEAVFGTVEAVFGTAEAVFGTAEAVFEAAAAGDPIARGVVDEVAGHLARAIRALVLSFGVSRVVIGGGVAGAGEHLLGPLLAAIERERSESPLVDAAFSSTTIELLPPAQKAGARGAAALVRDALAEQKSFAGGILAGSVKT
jgi:glucokinase